MTKDVPAGAVVAGNPARFLKWRDPAVASGDLESRLAAFARRVPEGVAALLTSCLHPETRLHGDQPGSAPHLRA